MVQPADYTVQVTVPVQPQPEGTRVNAVNGRAQQRKLVPKGVQPVDGLLIVEASIGDTRANVLLHSGANKAVITDALCKEAGIPILPHSISNDAKGIGGKIDFIGTAEIDFSLCGVTKRIDFAVAHMKMFDNFPFMILVGFRDLREFPNWTIDNSQYLFIMNNRKIPIGIQNSLFNIVKRELISPQSLRLDIKR